MEDIKTLQEKVARLASILNTYQQTAEEERVLLSRFFLNAADILSSVAAVVLSSVAAVVLSSVAAVVAPDQRTNYTVTPSILNASIRDLAGVQMTPRLANLLRKMDIETVADITKHSKHDFMKCRNLGRKAMAELENFMYNYGLTFEPWNKEEK